ncbi:hypothetical protein DXG01_015486 [Tephrocybe rancida]|nr:hypothetical protein DXG01_015486 [Tephrocybe rancida]
MIGISFVFLRTALIKDSGGPALDRLIFSGSAIIKWQVPVLWCQQLGPLLSDALIIWRAWVVFSKQRWAMYVSILLWLAATATSLASLGSIQVVSAGATQQIAANPIGNKLSIASIALSIATNFVATSFIACTLWTHLRFIRKHIETKYRASFRLWRTLLLLIDSGFLFFALQTPTSQCIQE